MKISPKLVRLFIQACANELLALALVFCTVGLYLFLDLLGVGFINACRFYYRLFIVF
jgi:hypothetical protein